MLRVIISSLTLLIAFVWPISIMANCHSSLKQTPEVVQKLEQYFESGSYLKDIDKKMLEAKAYLDRRLEKRAKDKFAIILDVDETAVSNYEGLKNHSFSTNMQAFAAHYLYAKLPPIGPVLGFYHYARSKDVDVFFIASRPSTPEIINATVLNLKQAGYKDWTDLFLMPIGDDTLTTQAFKTEIRKKIQDQGYTIVVNVGDQESDLNGGAAEVAVKLPNPFYFDKPTSHLVG